MFAMTGAVFAMTSVFSWQNSTSFCPASFCTPRPNLTVTPGEGKSHGPEESGGLQSTGSQRVRHD